jgi:hypothetical protein
MGTRTALIALPCALFCAAGLAQAEGTVGDLSKIQSDTLLLKAKAERAVAQSELDARSSVEGEGAAPVVKAVYGAGNQLYATFLYRSGVVMDAKPGDTILGGFKVVSVGVDKVELSKGRQRLAVGFAATAPTQPIAAPPFFPTMPGPIQPPRSPLPR